MRKIIIAVLLFTVVCGKSQNKSNPVSKIKLSQTKLYKLGKLGFFGGNTERNLFYYHISKDKLEVNVFNQNLELVKNKQVKLPNRYKDIRVTGVSMKDEEFKITSIFNNKKISKSVIFSESFDSNTFESKENFQETKLMSYLPEETVNNFLKFYFTSSGYRIYFTGKSDPDEWYLSTGKKLKTGGFNEPNDWYMNVYKDNAEGILEKKEHLYFAHSFSQLHSLEAVESYNDGNNLAVVTRYYPSKKEYSDFDEIRFKSYDDLVEKKIHKPNYHYAITFIDLTASTTNTMILKQLKVETSDNDFIRSLNISSIGHDSLMISGAYSSKDNINTKGVFSLIIEIDKASDIINIKDKYPFSNDFILKYKTDDEIVEMNLDKSRGVPYDFFDYNILSLDKTNEGYIATMEKSAKYITYVNERAGNVTIIYTIYNIFYSDLYLMYISADGKVKDVIKIPKRQVKASRITPLYFSLLGPSSLVRIIGNKTLIVVPDERKKYGDCSRRFISYIVNNETGKIDNDINNAYDILDNAGVTFDDPIWLNDYNLLTTATNKFGTKEKLVIVNFKEFVLGE